jgi:lysophospholipid acyltransferase (LPLAT)-like uncharacterized protein
MAKFRANPRLLGWMIAGLMKTLGATLRWRIDDRAGLLRGEAREEPLLWVCWHNRLLLTPLIFWKCLRHRPAAVLASASGDGDVLAAVYERFGVEAARGSSSRRGAAGLRECLTLIKRGLDIGITPDGPRYSVQPGLVLLAQQSGARVFPLHFHAHRCWRLKTWDGFIIPWPFSRVDVVFDALRAIPRSEDGEVFEAERAKMEALMRENTHD